MRLTKYGKAVVTAWVVVLLMVVESALYVYNAVTTESVHRQVEQASSSRIENLEGEVDTMQQAIYYYQGEEREWQSEQQAVDVSYVGDFMCTAYCTEKYPHICGTGDGITASGQPVQAGVTVAADPDVFPYGTVLYIEGVGIRVVQDTGDLGGGQLDVAVDTHENALKWSGYGTHAVYVLEVGNNE